MDVRRWSGWAAAAEDRRIETPAGNGTILKARGGTTMTLTPGLALLGIVLVLVAIPFAFSLAPLIVGAIVLIWAARRGHRELSIATPTAAAA